MAAGEYHQLPLTHNRVAFLEFSEDYLLKCPQQRRYSMNLLKLDGKVYHLDVRLLIKLTRLLQFVILTG